MKEGEAARLAERMMQSHGTDAAKECLARAEYRHALADFSGEAAWRRAAVKAQQKSARK